MKQKEKEILRIQQNFKDSLEKELFKQQKENVIIEIKDIKLVGKAIWYDKVNGKSLFENVFIVEKQVRKIEDKGNERIIEQKNYYLGDKCIAGAIVDDQLIYSENFKNFESDKMKAVNDLLDRTSERKIESNSMNNLQRKELEEVLSAYLGRKVPGEEVQKMLQEMDETEIDELKKQKSKDENDLSKKQIENIKVNGIQKADLNKLVDGKETLGKRLDLQQYDSLYIVYSDKIDDIAAGTKKNNTTYSLVGMTKNGEARVLNDEFEMDKTVGNNASKEQTKIRANNTATIDNNDLSVYTRKSNGMSIGCENNQGNVDIFLYQKTLEKNENVGIQVETCKTPIIPLETKEIMNRNKGIYQRDNVQGEIEEHIEQGCTPKDVKDFDGRDDTETHEHYSKEILNDYIMEIFNYENKNGEEKIKEVFTKNEIKDKLLRELRDNSDKIDIKQVVENIKEEMNQDAEIFAREHKL